ncbi:MAG: LTA synthase family protein [Hymenobacteraceae bacterium]|nr:LTA synthase family protein [Hymenobacteraceae bacterium]
MAYWSFWVGFFAVARAVFLGWNLHLAAALPVADVVRAFGYGLRLDASLAAYFALPAAVGLALGRRLPPGRLGARLLGAYTLGLLLVSALVVVVDAELYGHWGFRIDTTLLQYLNTPREMAASAATAPLGGLVLLYAALVGAGWWSYRRLSASFGPRPAHAAARMTRASPDSHLRAAQIRVFFVALGWAAGLVLPLRGGWQQIPVNQSDVYFSSRPFANHAAVNAGWNLLYFALRGDPDQNPYEYLPDSAARRLVAAVPDSLPQELPDSLRILRMRRPNVLIVILESFTGKVVGSLGAARGATPQLDSAAAAGLLFTHIYAAGNRSEKGLVAILSGYPSQPTTSLTKVPRKAEHLPHLARRLRGAGYRRATYWYGGELAFANMKAYLLNGGYDRLFEKRDFPARLYDEKWGVRDADLLPRLADSLRRQPQPWVSTVFTLSSHEPYDVPGPAAIVGTDEASRFRNAVHYTDRAVGRLLAGLRADRALWDSTLVVLVADHGHLLPGYTSESDPKSFRIPLVVTGGALRPTWRGRRIARIGSQTDLLATLLAQLGLPTADLQPWSRDLLRPRATPAAFYIFNDGFGLMTSAGNVSFDNVGRRVISRDAGVSDAQLRRGQALMQESFADFLRR